MCNRSEIVTNGCSGGCCEKFTLPVMIEDLHKMKAELNRVNTNRNKLSSEEKEDIIKAWKNSVGHEAPKEYFAQPITCSNGYERKPIYEVELDKLIDMLIPLGTTAYDPQSGRNYNEQFEYDPSMHSLEEVHNHTYGHYLIRNDQMLGMIFTCKHFDKENRVCTNYENRPEMCKNFGSNCRYKGCGYVKKMEEELKLAEDKMKLNYASVMESEEDISELKALQS